MNTGCSGQNTGRVLFSDVPWTSAVSCGLFTWRSQRPYTIETLSVFIGAKGSQLTRFFSTCVLRNFDAQCWVSAWKCPHLYECMRTCVRVCKWVARMHQLEEIPTWTNEFMLGAFRKILTNECTCSEHFCLADWTGNRPRIIAWRDNRYIFVEMFVYSCFLTEQYS